MENKDLLAELFLVKRGELIRYIRSHLYFKADAEDCLQEVFLTAVQKFDTIKSENTSRITGWLFLTARNIVSRFNRKYLNDKRLWDVDFDIETLIATDFSTQLIEDILYDEIDLPHFIELVTSTLSENEKELFVLKHQGKTAKEISEILNISAKAVKSKYSRIRQKLREQYKKVLPL